MDQNAFFLDVFKGDVARVKERLNQGIELTHRNSEGTEALFFAIEAGHEHILHLLIETGANPFSRDKLGRTAVHVAAFWNRVSILEELSYLGVHLDVPAPSQWDATPLHYAAVQGAEAAARWLLRMGCMASAQLTTGLTPADLARNKGHSKVAELLEQAAIGQPNSLIRHM